MHDDSPFGTPTPTPTPTPDAGHPLLAQLESRLGYPRLRFDAEVAAFTGRPGAHCLFIPGDARRNLETADAAVILPELRQAFRNAFDCAVADDSIEAALRERHHALKTPGLLFFRDGLYLGAIEKVRDWPDYLARITHLLKPATA